MPMDWIDLNFNQLLTSRETFFNCVKSTHSKTGNNLLSSRLTVLNKKIKLQNLNMSIVPYKVTCKHIFMPSE